MKKCKICKKPAKWGKFASKEELANGLCPECLNKPFEITSVCRADLVGKFTPEEISKMDDSDMKRLASKMADAYCNSGFWIDMEILAQAILDDN